MIDITESITSYGRDSQLELLSSLNASRRPSTSIKAFVQLPFFIWLHGFTHSETLSVVYFITEINAQQKKRASPLITRLLCLRLCGPPNLYI